MERTRQDCIAEISAILAEHSTIEDIADGARWFSHWTGIEDGRLTFTLEAGDAKDGKDHVFSIAPYRSVFTVVCKNKHNWMRLAVAGEVETDATELFSNYLGHPRHKAAEAQEFKEALLEAADAGVGPYDGPQFCAFEYDFYEDDTETDESLDPVDFETVTIIERGDNSTAPRTSFDDRDF